MVHSADMGSNVGGMAGNGGASSAGGMAGAGGIAGSDGIAGSVTPQGGAGGGLVCPQLKLVLKPAAGSEARVMLAVERSYSMIMTQDRWTPLRDGIETVISNLTDSVQFWSHIVSKPQSRT